MVTSIETTQGYLPWDVHITSLKGIYDLQMCIACTSHCTPYLTYNIEIISLFSLMSKTTRI